METTLGTASTQTLVDLTELILLARTSKEMQRLRDEQRDLAAHMQVLIDRQIDETLPAYKKALTALEAANETAAEAKTELDKIAGYIKRTGRAIGLVGKLVTHLG